jgi:hypothetical protein
MRTQLVAGLAAAALAVAGCGGGRRPVQIDQEQLVVGNRWNAMLATPAGLVGVSQIKGTGWMGTNGRDTSQTRAEVSITNAVPGGEHPWHVHIGQCGRDQGIFGPAGAYRPLVVGDNGQAQSSAVLEAPLPASGQYFVNVHASRNNMGTIVACGNLAPPIR